MNWLVIVNKPQNRPLTLPGIEVVSARNYLTEPHYAERRRLRIVNLCRDYSYQSNGYYVSLLAEARGHRVMPDVSTLQDFKSPTVLRTLADTLDPLIQRTLAPLQGNRFTLSIYFKRNTAERYDALCRELFNLFQAPLMRAQFVKTDERWTFVNISPITPSEIPESHLNFAEQAAAQFFNQKSVSVKTISPPRFDLAMLVDKAEPTPPSNEKALKKFELAAKKLGIRLRRIGREDYDELAEYDGLFIRATTAVNHYTYRFARKAEAEGMTVIDDTTSILRCTNKVYLQELLTRHHIPVPRTIILHKDNINKVIDQLKLPCVLKKPDSSFSQGVVKVSTIEEYKAETQKMLASSELLIAQAYAPTEFDWRIGIIDGDPFYACRYYMARGHWQIYNHSARSKSRQDGRADAIALDQVPADVLQIATKAASRIGNGLYGVDIKEIDGQAKVIEVNDNPSIDAGVEDFLITDALYERIMTVFLQRMEKRRMATKLKL